MSSVPSCRVSSTRANSIVTRPGIPRGYLHRWGPDENDLMRAIVGRGFGSVLSARYLGPYPETDWRAETHTGDEALTDATRGGGVCTVDPSSQILVELLVRASPRIQLMPIAQRYRDRLPLDPAVFDSADEIRALAVVTLLPQGDKPAAASAPYFRVDRARSPWRSVNRALLEETIQLNDGERPVAAWVEMPFEAMANGLLRALASDYRSANYLFVRVAGFAGGYAPRDQVRELLLGLSHIEGLGVRPILDCVGSGGVAALTVGAHAYTGGYPYYRHVPAKLLQGGGPRRPGQRLRWLRADTLAELTSAEAAAALADGTIGDCSLGCDPTTTEGRRAHAIHVTRERAARTLAQPADRTLEWLSQCESRPARTWAAAAAEVIGITLPKTHSAR